MGRHDGHGVVGLIPEQRGEFRPQQPAHLCDDRGEDVRRRVAARHKRRDASQRRLFFGEKAQVVAARLQRAGHVVERALERADLTGPVLGGPQREVAAGESAGHLG